MLVTFLRYLGFMESIAQRLVSLVSRVTDIDAAEIDLDAPLALDSLTLIELAVRVEEEFGKRIDSFSPTTLRDVVKLVES